MICFRFQWFRIMNYSSQWQSKQWTQNLHKFIRMKSKNKKWIERNSYSHYFLFTLTTIFNIFFSFVQQICCLNHNLKSIEFGWFIVSHLGQICNSVKNFNSIVSFSLAKCLPLNRQEMYVHLNTVHSKKHTRPLQKSSKSWMHESNSSTSPYIYTNNWPLYKLWQSRRAKEYILCAKIRIEPSSLFSLVRVSSRTEPSRFNVFQWFNLVRLRFTKSYVTIDPTIIWWLCGWCSAVTSLRKRNGKKAWKRTWFSNISFFLLSEMREECNEKTTTLAQAHTHEPSITQIGWKQVK